MTDQYLNFHIQLLSELDDTRFVRDQITLSAVIRDKAQSSVSISLSHDVDTKYITVILILKMTTIHIFIYICHNLCDASSATSKSLGVFTVIGAVTFTGGASSWEKKSLVQQIDKVAAENKILLHFQGEQR